MYLFPERDERGNRWLLAAALVLSIAIHFGIGPAVRWWWPRIEPAIAKVLPRPTATPEIVALSDAITIEKRTVPRASRRSPRQERRVQQLPRKRTVAQLSTMQPMPTLPPVPSAAPTARVTVEPTVEPTYRPHGTVHLPRAEPTVEPRPRVERR